MCVFKTETQSQFQYFRCTTELSKSSVPIESMYDSVMSVYFTDKNPVPKLKAILEIKLDSL